MAEAWPRRVLKSPSCTLVSRAQFQEYIWMWSTPRFPDGSGISPSRPLTGASLMLYCCIAALEGGSVLATGSNWHQKKKSETCVMK